MITNIPTEDDFSSQGLLFLNLAWDSIFGVLKEHKNAEKWDYTIIENEDEYKIAASKPVAISHALAQQGAELILKSRIVKVSPYLLISGSPKDWPSGCSHKDAAFADFRTIDVQDLIRTHDTVSSNQLPESFKQTFEESRKQRNALFHTVDNRLNFSEKVIVKYILSVSALLETESWPKLRRHYLENNPTSHLFGTDFVVNELCSEMAIMISRLNPAELREFFRFEKTDRPYICPYCYWECDKHADPDFPTTARLMPNEPTSTTVYCFVCDQTTTVVRKDCNDPDCKGNVISTSDDLECLTCFDAQPE